MVLRIERVDLFTVPRMRTTPLLLAALCIACSGSEPAKAPDRPIQVVPGSIATAGTVATGVGGTAGTTAGTTAVGNAGTLAIAGTPGAAGVSAPGVGGIGTAGRGGPPRRPDGPAGAPAIAGTGAASMPAGTAGMAAAAGGAAPPPGTDPFAAERQACVDHINMYRATLMLAPLKRATPEQETCSDEGAKQDGDTGQAHSSAGKCRGLGGQNTCPGYPIRGGSLTATLKGCLDQMWAEGEPANGVQACIQDRTGCFLMHGHWINMSMASNGTVACGFYKMANGRYWMNQNFGR